MTTSGTTSASMTAGEVVMAALQEFGVIGAGEIPTPEDTAVGLRSLNWLLKSLQARGADLWRQANGEVIIPANTGAGALAPDIQDVSSVRFSMCGGYERPLFRYERGQYLELPNKCAAGAPTVYYFDRQRDAPALYVWPVPRDETTVLLDYVRRIQDVTDATQTLDVPQHWTEAVYLSLAARLATVFGTTRVDPGTVQLVSQRASGLVATMLDDDRPASYFMGVA